MMKRQGDGKKKCLVVLYSAGFRLIDVIVAIASRFIIAILLIKANIRLLLALVLIRWCSLIVSGAFSQ